MPTARDFKDFYGSTLRFFDLYDLQESLRSHSPLSILRCPFAKHEGRVSHITPLPIRGGVGGEALSPKYPSQFNLMQHLGYPYAQHTDHDGIDGTDHEIHHRTHLPLLRQEQPRKMQEIILQDIDLQCAAANQRHSLFLI